MPESDHRSWAAGLLAEPRPPEIALPTLHKQPRYTGIDALRGLAAVQVLLSHVTWMYQVLYGFPGHAPPMVKHGTEAVYLFFIISGFVILLTAERVAGAGDFLRSRATRLYPAYWACLLISFAGVRALGLPGREYSWARLAVNLTMFQGFVGVGDVDNVYWSLRVEMCFYLWVAALLAIGRLRWLPMLLALLMAASLCWQAIAAFPPVSADHRSFAAKLAETVLLARFAHYFAAGTAIQLMRTGRRLPGFMLASAALARVAILETREGIAVAVVIFAVVCAVARFDPRWLSNRALLFLGAISYPLYLVHNNLGMAIIRRALAAGLGSYAAIGVATAFAVLVASLVTYSIERPALRWAKARRRAHRQW